MISATANMLYDSFLTVQGVFNSRGPSTAIGSGLDIIVKNNGIKRLSAVYSSVFVVLTGSEGTVITKGVVGDINNNNWNLASPVTIGADGTVTVLATSQIEGPIIANIGDINKIVTPTFGWESVINNTTATIGTYTETDSKLRSRQGISTAQPSRTVLSGTKGAIAAVSGVTRFEVYENDTNVINSDGHPPHSITVVTEGGTDNDIAQAIYMKKGIGGYTNGTTSVLIYDEKENPVTIRFYKATYVDIDVTLDIKALSGYTTDMTNNIKNSVVDFINSLSLGSDLSISSLWGASLSAMDDMKKPSFSVVSVIAGRHSETQATSDIVTLFNEVVRGISANITINVS